MSSEKWKSVPFLKGYECSNLGRIRNIQTGTVRKGTKDKKGYLRGNFFNKNYKFHRIVAMTWIENKDDMPMVNHINGDKSDNRVLNLEWSNNSLNQKHAYKLGLQKPYWSKANRHKSILGKPVTVIQKDMSILKFSSIAACADYYKMSTGYALSLLTKESPCRLGNYYFKSKWLK